MGNNKNILGALETFLHDFREGKIELRDFVDSFGEKELSYLLKMARTGEIAQVYFTGDKEEIVNDEEEIVNDEEVIKNTERKRLRIQKEADLSKTVIEDESDESIYNETYWLPLEFVDENEICFGQLEVYFILTGFDMEGEEPFIDTLYSVPFFSIEVDGQTQILEGFEGLKYIFEHYYDEIAHISDCSKEVLYENKGTTFD
jgi:hypothetical protein